MLKLINIKKDYIVADSKVHALKGLDITFRDSEFVSILGPSGCGKTTLLNLIGGLDHYTDGELIIDGISTKKYTDRDWDTYRNHRIGFIFQSYNLIPHQTILENVELALEIAGINKEERVKKAKQALDEVGLKDQYNKKPNQLSGGQCQRVAIARALVNEPEILLADEPTGALDTVTSVQIMDLIKEIAKKRLVIMVTHNPELAEQYSTRIVKLLDGNIVSDSNPFDEKEGKKKEEVKDVTKKSKLSFWSAFRLSARNLKSKFKRTAMVCFAGSIGIIGVATVLSVSNGVTGYISKMQDDMLSGNPITIGEETIDLSKIMEATDTSDRLNSVKIEVEEGYINVDKTIDYLVTTSQGISSVRVQNDITQDYVDYVYNMDDNIYSAIVSYFGVNVANNIYTDVSFQGENGNKNMSLSSILKTYESILTHAELEDLSSYIAGLGTTFNQAPNNVDFILEQYDFVSDPNTSKIPTEKNEIMIVVDKDYQLSDLLLAQLGYYNQEQFMNVVYKSMGNDKYNENLDLNKISYEDLINKKFTWYPNNTVFTKQTNAMLAQVNPFTYSNISSEEWAEGIEFEITAIVKPKEDISYGCLTSGFYYTEALAKYIIEDSLNSEIVKFIDEQEEDSYTSLLYNNVPTGITYYYDYEYEDQKFENQVAFVGSVNQFAAIAGTAMGQTIPETYTLTLREVGGKDTPSEIAIYPVDFELKDEVTKYLDVWNSDEDIEINGKVLTKDDRSEVTYNDNLSIVISLINNMINIITYALVAFTSLSLVVSTVMIAIITYVSVIERVKEIGVIRALGGRKKDVSRLFNAETFIIGLISGLIGVGITYLLSALINVIVGSLSGIYTIASLPWTYAVILVVISILLTSISGLIPAKIAAKKDPVDALRSE